MVHFGKTLLAEQKQEYKGYYIDYKGLKFKIKDIVEVLSINGDLSDLDIKVKSFLSYLDLQIGIAAIFYEGLVDDIGHQVSSIRHKWELLNPDTLPYVYNQTKLVAKLIGDCFKFLELNTEGTRKILKKAEKLTKQDTLSKDSILIDMLRPDKMDSKLTKLRVHKGMHKLIDEVRDRINFMRALEAEWLESGLIDKKYYKSLHKRQDTQELVDSMYSTATKMLKTTHWYYGLLAQAHIDYESEPVGASSKMGLFLNNFNTFLYMVNYYIVIPTANEYAVAVGLSQISSGYLLAMTPLSSLLSSIIYSLWSNKSFKIPLFCCSILLCIGNFLYALALNYESSYMLFIGRIIVGFGNNRAINRRYIADFVPIDRRTFHSAIFVAIGALGMSLGPGLQPLLSLISFNIPLLNWKVNELTAPGWLLFVLWTCFSIQILISFKEPERRYAIEREELQLKHLLDNEDSIVKISSWKDSFKRIFFFGRKCQKLNLTGTIICLFVYFFLKLIQESIQTAAPLVTSYWFNWTDIGVAYLLGAIGLLVVPLNLTVGWISNRISDRVTQVLFIIGILLGCFVILTYNFSNYSIFQYVSGFVLIFLFAQLLEGINMGLLSKVMPKSLSQGLFNSGFLSTEAGTAGRVFGSVIVSIAGLNGLSTIQNLIIIPSIIFHIIVITIIIYFWNSLVPSSHILSSKRTNQADELLKTSYCTKDTRLVPLVGSSFNNFEEKFGIENRDLSSHTFYSNDNTTINQADLLPNGIKSNKFSLENNSNYLFVDSIIQDNSIQEDYNFSVKDTTHSNIEFNSFEENKRNNSHSVININNS